MVRAMVANHDRPNQLAQVLSPKHSAWGLAAHGQAVWKKSFPQTSSLVVGISQRCFKVGGQAQRLAVSISEH